MTTSKPTQFGGRFGAIETADLHAVEGLQRLDKQFLEGLQVRDQVLHQELLEYRLPGHGFTPLETSEFLLALAPHVETFIARLFGIEKALTASKQQTLSHDEVMAFKKNYVLRRARRYRGEVTQSFAELNDWLNQKLQKEAKSASDREAAVAHYGMHLLDAPDDNAAAIEQLTRWCVLALKGRQGQEAVKGWVSFKLPQRVDHADLVPLQRVDKEALGAWQSAPEKLHRRDGFKLTDQRMSIREVQNEVHYCIYCHDHEGDYCSKGFPHKKGDPAQGFKTDPSGITLTGCPLEEKISEMHQLKRDGHTIAALAMAMVDNPMIPATGHRICNDCMKACIYQKQDPVNIPQIETGILTDVLALPWGVEIYDLLTRWNPLRHTQYLPKPYNGHKVLVVGQGPAGFTMAHHLTMEGCAVVGIDGLKIEPLPEKLLKEPVRDYADLVESLDTRILTGFGGVAEYGITVRWDKNFLKLIYLSLARRPTFQVFGGVRLGGTITLEDAWDMGFDHLCIANGAGLPRVIPMENSLARGMRQASDFLMALQLTGAAKADSLANLQVRLPAVVIGGGLTAIDTATEVQAYYIAQVEKVLSQYEHLVEAEGDAFQEMLDEENAGILAEFLQHGRAVRAERERAGKTGEAPDFVPLLRSWGGVTIVYRRSLNESPAYQRNHEEVIQAMAEGIYYRGALEPANLILDRFNHVKELVCRYRAKQRDRWTTTDEEIRLPARAVFVAAGAMPNTIYEAEYPGTFKLKRNHFQPHALTDGDVVSVPVAEHCKDSGFGAFTSYSEDHHRVTFIGDAHPVFHGSVVKAIASAMRSYPEVMRALSLSEKKRRDDYAGFRGTMTDLLMPRVVEVKLDNPSVVELWVHAPLAARNFRPGHFFRMQTFESLSPLVKGTRLQIPLQTVSGAGVDGDKVRLMILRGGVNPRLAARLKPGDPLVLMGPTGAATHIPENKTVMVIAGSWGAAVMLSLGPALRAAGCRVLYLAAYRSAGDLYCQHELESTADLIVWATAFGEQIKTHRKQDISVSQGNIIDLIEGYGEGKLAGLNMTDAISLSEVDEILVMGSTNLLRGLQQALRKQLQSYFRPDVNVMGTVGSPMQCMLKGVCAQCLQWQIDPATGKRTHAVFSCAAQDQPLFNIDIDNLAARQAQNRLPDFLTSLWLDYILAHHDNNPGRLM